MRAAACELAGVEPSFTIYGGADPDGYALTINVARRHMTKGQRAMVTAMAYPEPAKLKRAGSLETKQQDVHKARLSQARKVFKILPATAAAVVAGAVSLDDAYEKAVALTDTLGANQELQIVSRPGNEARGYRGRTRR